MLLAAAAAEPTVETLERGVARVSRTTFARHRGPPGRDRRRHRPVHAIRCSPRPSTSLATAAELRAAHAGAGRCDAVPDARARHLAQAAGGPDEAVASALAEAAEHARLRGATLDAAALYQEASRLTPDGRRARPRLDRARLAAECLFIDLSEYLEADRILEAAIDRAPPGPARADALSLRAIIRYYHGRVPEAIALGEQALAEAGDDPELRARVLGRLGYLAMQLDLERGVGTRRRGGRTLLRRARPRTRRPRTPSRTRCSSAPTASSRSSGRRGRATSSAASA